MFCIVFYVYLQWAYKGLSPFCIGSIIFRVILIIKTVIFAMPNKIYLAKTNRFIYCNSLLDLETLFYDNDRQ